MNNLKVAIIGAGSIAHYHARALLAQQNVEITWICDILKDKAQKFASQYGVSRICSNALELAQRDDIDAAILALPNKFHAPYTIEFLQNGKDVLVEKPMAVNSQEGAQIGQAARTNKRIVSVGHMWRFDTEVNFVREVVTSGQIGTIIKTQGYSIHVDWGPNDWFTQKEQAGGGALADMGVHAIDTVRCILGNPIPKQVYAKIGTFYGNYDVDDTGIIIITWDNGTTSIIETGWWQPHMDGPEAATRIFGTSGYASLFPTLLKLKIGGFPGVFNPIMPARADHCDQVMYTRQMAHFIECIRSRRPPMAGFTEGQVVLNIVDAAYSSSESGRVVDI